MRERLTAARRAQVERLVAHFANGYAVSQLPLLCDDRAWYVAERRSNPTEGNPKAPIQLVRELVIARIKKLIEEESR